MDPIWSCPLKRKTKREELESWSAPRSGLRGIYVRWRVVSPNQLWTIGVGSHLQISVKISLFSSLGMFSQSRYSLARLHPPPLPRSHPLSHLFLPFFELTCVVVLLAGRCESPVLLVLPVQLEAGASDSGDALFYRGYSQFTATNSGKCEFCAKT